MRQVCVTYATPGQYPRGNLSREAFGQPFCGYDTIGDPTLPNPILTTEIWGGIIPCDELDSNCPTTATAECRARIYDVFPYGEDGAPPRFAPPCTNGIYVYTVHDIAPFYRGFKRLGTSNQGFETLNVGTTYYCASSACPKNGIDTPLVGPIQAGFELPSGARKRYLLTVIGAGGTTWQCSIYSLVASYSAASTASNPNACGGGGLCCERLV